MASLLPEWAYRTQDKFNGSMSQVSTDGENCNGTLMKGSVSSSGIRGGVLGHLEACKSTIYDGLHAGVKNTFARVHTYAYCMQLAGLFGPRSRVPTPCQEVSLSSMSSCVQLVICASHKLQSLCSDLL